MKTMPWKNLPEFRDCELEYYVDLYDEEAVLRGEVDYPDIVFYMKARVVNRWATYSSDNRKSSSWWMVFPSGESTEVGGATRNDILEEIREGTMIRISEEEALKRFNLYRVILKL